MVRQEGNAKPRIHFYIEPKNGAKIDAGQTAGNIRKQLGELHPLYTGLEDMSKVSLEVTLMPNGAFGAYMMKQRAAGADLAHLKPPHVNPSGDIVDFLMNPVS